MTKKKDLEEIVDEVENTEETEEIIEEKDLEEIVDEVENTEETNLSDESVSNENSVELLIKVAFTDKYNDKQYKIGDAVLFSQERATELLNDPRHLVSLNK